MATYTDLQNKIKETLNVGYTDRITTQPVKMYNETNEYWGTFKGTVAVDDVAVDGGQIRNVEIYDSALCGKVVLPGGVNLTEIGHMVTQMSTDVEQVQEVVTGVQTTLANEIVERKLADAELEKKILSANLVVDGKLSVLDHKIDDVKDVLCAEIHHRIAEDEKIAGQISELSGAIDNTNSNLWAEVEARKSADSKLSTEIYTESLNRKADIVAAKRELSNYVDATETALSNDLTAYVEKAKHYTRNIMSDKIWPYASKDFAINYLEVDPIPAGYLLTNSGNIAAKIDAVVSNEVEKSITFTTDLKLQDGLDVILGRGQQYYVKAGEVTPALDTHYYIEVNAELNGLTINRRAHNYLPLSCTALNRELSGCITEYKITDGQFISGHMTITENGSVLEDFRKFPHGMTFDRNDPTKCKVTCDNDEIFFDATNDRFEFRKDLQSLSVTEFTYGLTNKVGARVYHGCGDIIYAEDGSTIKALNILYNGHKHWLTEDNGFKSAVVDAPYNFLSCKIDAQLSLDVREEKTTYWYVGTRFDEPLKSKPEYNVSVILTDFNRHLSDELDNQVCVIFKHPTSYAGEYMLEKQDDDTWQTTVGALTISFNKSAKTISLNKVTESEVFSAGFDIDESTESVKTYSCLPVKDVDGETIYFKPENLPLSYKIESVPTATYVVNWCPSRTIPEDPHHLFRDDSFASDIRVSINQIEAREAVREASYVVKLHNGGEKKLVPFKLVSEEDPARILAETLIPTEVQVYMRALQVGASQFILQRIDTDQSDWRFNWLSAKIYGLSGEVSDISSTLSTAFSLSVDALQDQIDLNKAGIIDLYHQISGGMAYKDVLSLDVVPPFTEKYHEAVLSNLFMNNYLVKIGTGAEVEISGMPLRNGFYYLANSLNKAARYTFSGLKIQHGDMLIIKDNCHVSSLNETQVTIFNAMDSDAVHEDLLSAISVELSTDYSGKINVLSDGIDTISSVVDNICTDLSITIDALCTDLSVAHDNLCTDLSIAISTNTTNIHTISTDIYKNVNSGDLSTRGLSGKVEFLLSSDKSSMCYGGTLQSIDPGSTRPYVLSNFLTANFKRADGFLKKGFTFRLSSEQVFYPDDRNKKYLFFENDYFIVNKDVMVSNITSTDIDVIYDASHESFNISSDLSALRLSVEEMSAYIDEVELSVAGVSSIVDVICSDLSGTIDSICTDLSIAHDSLCTELSIAHNELCTNLSTSINTLCTDLSTDVDYIYENNCVKLSGNNVILNTNEFTDYTKLNEAVAISLSAESLSVNFNYVFDYDVSRRLSDLLDDLTDNSRVLETVSLINDIIAYAKLTDISPISIQTSYVSDIVDRTVKICAAASVECDTTNFHKICESLNRSLRALPASDYCSTLQYRLKQIQKSIDFVEKYVGKIEESLSTLSAYSHEAINAIRLSVDDLSNDVSRKYDYLSSELSDYHNTLSGIDRMHDTFGDIKSDNLILTDQQTITYGHGHDRYYLTLLSGTMVLMKI